MSSLYVFITHQKNLSNVYTKIQSMFNDNLNYVIVQGGGIEDFYNEDERVLTLNCNDTYIGLPEKVIKTFHFLINDDRFKNYTHFCKLDDDMEVIHINQIFEGDYLGKVHYNDGNRKWHMGRTNTVWDKIPYLGEFKPWCMGGYGYVVSRTALEKCLPNFSYTCHIYEDLCVGIMLNEVGIYPVNIDTNKFFISPDHR
jgi:hypothetical protein